jgi:hypothetical protein
MSTAAANGSEPTEWQKSQEESDAIISGLQEGMDDEDRDKVELLEKLSKSDLNVEDQALQNLASRDIPTANFDETEVAEYRNYVDVALYKKIARYPHPGQDVTGALREVVHDDVDAGLEPRDKGDILDDETFGQVAKARVTKAKGGALVRSILESIKHSIVSRDGDDGGSERILGKLRK